MARRASRRSPSIVKDGDGYVVAWQEGSITDSPPVAVDVRRLDATGKPMGNVREITTTATEARPMLVSAYQKLALTWMDDKGTPAMPNGISLVAFLNSQDFSFDGPQPVQLLPANQPTPRQDMFPVLTLSGDQLMATWMDAGQTVYLANVSSSLTVSTPAELYTSQYTAQQGDMVATDGATFTAWEDLSGDIDTGRERHSRHLWPMDDGQVGAGGIVHEFRHGLGELAAPRVDGGGEPVAVVYY